MKVDAAGSSDDGEDDDPARWNSGLLGPCAATVVEDGARPWLQAGRCGQGGVSVDDEGHRGRRDRSQSRSDREGGSGDEWVRVSVGVDQV